MEARPSKSIPQWVYKKNGQLVPFDEDQIALDLFTATEWMKSPNPYLARELTGSVLHFLAEEMSGVPPTTAGIFEMVVKVVRELGHPILAQTFSFLGSQPARAQVSSQSSQTAKEKLEDYVQLAVEEFCRKNVFSPDIMAAHYQGLITLHALNSPHKLLGTALPPPVSTTRPIGQEDPGNFEAWVIHSFAEVSSIAGGFTSWDHPEFQLVGMPDARGKLGEYFQAVRQLARICNLRFLVNLNSRVPPPWATLGAEGPLFKTFSSQDHQQYLEDIRGEILELLCEVLPVDSNLWVNWHLGPLDCKEPSAQFHLVTKKLLDLATSTGRLTFVFDRKKKSLDLGPGITRQSPHMLMAVNLNLPALLSLPQVLENPDSFLDKLASLVHLGLSAVCQKRKFLSKLSSQTQNPLQPYQRGFILARARALIVPCGLDTVVKRITGEGMASSTESLDFAKKIVSKLNHHLREGGKSYNLDAVLGGHDSILSSHPLGPVYPTKPGEDMEETQLQPDLTSWNPQAPHKIQLASTSLLHEVVQSGTATLLLHQDKNMREGGDFLRWVWRETAIYRLILHKIDKEHQQHLPGLGPNLQ